METRYNFLDHFSGQRHSVLCRLESYTERTAVIILLEGGPKGSLPGTRMRVHRKSLDYFRSKDGGKDMGWRKYTYAD